MKFQTKIRMQMLMVGLGAALFLAGTARAQQDMDPTYFDVNPGAPAVSRAAAVRVAQLPRTVKADTGSESTLALASSNEGTLEAGVTRMAIVDAGVALIMLAGIVSIVLYAFAATRRERRFRASTVSAPFTHVSAATAQ